MLDLGLFTFSYFHAEKREQINLVSKLVLEAYLYGLLRKKIKCVQPEHHQNRRPRTRFRIIPYVFKRCYRRNSIASKVLRN